MAMRNPLLLSCLLLWSLISGCQVDVDPISYGKDECHFCKMRIMDPRFGTEMITQKGRMYKFDSVECLLDQLSNPESAGAQCFVTSYANPNTLIAAETAFYLISPNMPSPMGAYLNAFTSKEEALTSQQKASGEVLSWANLIAQRSK
jgi:copper chaperone NosL